MRFSVRKLLPAIFLASLLFFPATLCAQDKTAAPPKDPERAFVDSLVSQAWNDVNTFFRAKGKRDMTKHPGRRWADILWQYRVAHPDEPAARSVAGTAIYLQMMADDADGAYARLATLSPDDPVWPSVLPYLTYFGSDKLRDRFLQLAEKLLTQTQRETTKASLDYLLAGQYRKKDPDKSKAYLRAAIEAAKAAASARWWEDSEGFLYELTYLNVGQSFPHFSAPTTDNKTFSPEDLRGKTVLLNFWATW